MLQVILGADLRGGPLPELEFLAADLDVTSSWLIGRVGHGANLGTGAPIQLPGLDLCEKERGASLVKFLTSI